MLKDGYVGLMKAPGDGSDAPIINRMNVSVEEVVDGLGQFRSLTNAKFSITNLDLSENSPTGITKIKVELANFLNSETDYLKKQTDLPGEWITLETIQVNTDKNGLTGRDNVINFTVKNVPAHIEGYWHKFRLTLYNWAETPAIFNPEIDQKFSIDSSNIIKPDPEWYDDQFEGLSIQLFENQTPILKAPAPIYKNTHDNLFYATGAPRLQGMYRASADSFSFEETTHYYALGPDGKGYEFNGIANLREIVGIPGLEVLIEDMWIADDDLEIPLLSNSIKIRFNNMFGRPTLLDHTFADGTIAHVTTDQWNAIDHYLVYVYVSDVPKAPTLMRPEKSEEFDRGDWYLLAEIKAIKKSYKEKPYIEATLTDLPRGKYLWFYIGGFTGLGVSSMEIEPVPIFEDGRRIGTNAILGGSAIVEYWSWGPTMPAELILDGNTYRYSTDAHSWHDTYKPEDKYMQKIIKIE